MMKKLAVLSVIGCAILGLTAGSDATAGEPAPAQTAARLAVNPAILKIFASSIHGTVDMTAARNGQFASMTCDHLSVSATSVATNPCAPGAGFCVPTPKWTHTQAHLTATANPAICNYSIPVPAGQAFGLSVTTPIYAPSCAGAGFTYVSLKQTTSTGPQTVPPGVSKEANLVVALFMPECAP